MSFGGNPPWQRNSLGNSNQQNAIASLQSQMMNTNFVGFQNLAMAQPAPQNNLAIIPPIGANIGALNNSSAMFTNQHQTIQYQNPRSVLNPNAFATVQNAQAIQQGNSNNQTAQVCNKIGTITKFQPNGFGFIDDEIIFHKNTYKGQNPPKIGDRVLVEAKFNNNSAFKWNATVVQSMPSNQSQIQTSVQSQQQQQSRNFPAFSSMSQPQTTFSGNSERGANPVRSHSSRQSPPARRNSQDRNSRREKDRERDKERERDREREREKDREKRDDRSPARRISPRRRTRPIPRYNVQVPKINLNATEADVLELRRRYNNLYVPSDFFFSQIRWSESFPPHAPFSLQKPCTFHVFHKSVANPNAHENHAELDPPDADSTFSAKVMLMGVPPMSEFYRKCFASADEKERDDLVHPTRLINFLVGVFGKNEATAIGGAWSPSLDGPNPEKDPSVLIKTAIRTCKAMTGIDLSSCTQWYRFVELYYRRMESVRKGRVIPARTQTVVIFLPDIRSCIPTRVEWDELNAKYKRRFDLELKKQKYGNDDNEKKKSISSSPEEKIIDTSTLNVIDEVGEDNDDNNDIELDAKNADSDLSKDEATLDGGDAGTTEATIEKEDKNASKMESELDVKAMKITELRDELDARGLSSKGLKPQLVARLTKALKAEETEAIAIDASATDDSINQNISKDSSEINDCDSNEGMDIDMTDIVVIDEYDSTKVDNKQDESSKKESSKKFNEREQRFLEKRYRLPENPQILVHPVQHHSLDKFTCEVMSLSILLDYRPDDTKKHCFEVSLFAELFNEMLMRDFGFNIYKTLFSMPEIESDDKAKEKRDKSNVDHKSDDDEPKDKRVRKETAETKEIESNSGSTSEKASKETKDKHKERRTSRRDEDSDDDSMRSTDGKKRDHKKLITVDPDLLLSFVYFDQTHCGYIFSNHLEELFYALGLRLSRADTKKIVGRVAPRSLFYRKLTDKPKDEKIEPVTKETPESIEELGKGNNRYLPIFRNNKPLNLEQSSIEVQSDEIAKEGDSTESHMVMHKGALIDIEKLLQQMSRSEKAREETELRLIELTKTNSELQSSSSKAKDKIKDLQSELKTSNRKLGDTESSLSSTNKKCSEYQSILSGIHDKVSPLFVKSERSKKESSTREKDRRDREKDKSNSSSSSKEKDVKQEKTTDVKAEVKQE